LPDNTPDIPHQSFPMTLTIRPARPGDAALILRLVHELAEYEKLTHEVQATEGMIDETLFGPSPRAFCDIAEWDGEPVGQALWFYNYSTFSGRHGIFLEDLYVQPKARGKGIGKALLIHLARRCVEENLTRFEWSVLDWNTPSIEFYKSQGAVMMDGWTGCRVTGDALIRLAGQGA
jgi:GNAT superfamily N-acetyltransferase